MNVGEVFVSMSFFNLYNHSKHKNSPALMVCGDMIFSYARISSEIKNVSCHDNQAEKYRKCISKESARKDNDSKVIANIYKVYSIPVMIILFQILKSISSYFVSITF